jgi:hypothetical protein
MGMNQRATTLPREIAERWRPGVVLKRDVFSTIERGQLQTPDGTVDAVLRRTNEVPWWSWPIARLLLWRERRALRVVGPMGVGPEMLMSGNGYLVRSWIPGAPLNIYSPHGEDAFFKSAKATLRTLHRNAVCHNDLAKLPNWLRGNDGRAYVVDYQLAVQFRRRHKLFRICAYEDLRHLLKYKRLFAPELMTPRERQVVANKSIFARAWLASGKKVYQYVTRRILGFSDHEGLGPRFVHDARRLTAVMKSHEQVRDVETVAYPTRDKATALHAFVEFRPGLTVQALRDFIASSNAPEAPERIQLVAALPRDQAGRVRTEILRLIAIEQVAQAELLAKEDQKDIVTRIIAERPTVADRSAA